MLVFGAGTPRSGTRTISRYLNDAGIPVGYEATGKHCLKYGHDSEFIKQVYRDLGTGDISYVTTLALHEILEVYPDAFFIHYMRHPYDSTASILERTSDGPQVSRTLVVWTPLTGVFRGTSEADVPLRTLMSGPGTGTARWSEIFRQKRLGFSGTTGTGVHASMAAQLASYWVMTHETVAEFALTLPVKQTFRLRIEDIHEDGPKLLAALGVDARPELVRMNKAKAKRAELSQAEKDIVYGIAGECMARYGYEKDHSHTQELQPA